MRSFWYKPESLVWTVHKGLAAAGTIGRCHLDGDRRSAAGSWQWVLAPSTVGNRQSPPSCGTPVGQTRMWQCPLLTWLKHCIPLIHTYARYLIGLYTD
jgi:hypothetical protein